MLPLMEPASSSMEAPLVDEPAAHEIQNDAEKLVRRPSAHPRLASLDVVRGFTMLLMIFVDEVGDAYPHINHSPWNNITLADFVMPWFLFMVGTSMTFSLRKYQRGGRPGRLAGSRAVLWRGLKLFLLGVLLQGGGWIDGYSYGYNLATIRWCGILQRCAGAVPMIPDPIPAPRPHESPPMHRIGYAYTVAALLELWVPERQLVESAVCPY
jgi:hypothetical protein